MSETKKILVTGGAGFIGSHTVVSLIESGYTPIIIDDFRNSKPFILDRLQEITGSEILHYNIDCNQKHDMERVFNDHDITGVIHFAADKAVGESVELPLKYYHNNLNSLVTLLSLCQDYEVKNIVFSSSCTVYGEPESIPVTEEAEEQIATSPYGYTKQVCERICRDAASSSDFNITLLRYFNPVGAHPSGKIGELPLGVPNNLVPFVTQTAAGIREQLTIYGKDYKTPDGTCIRDYIHVCDLADAHVKALQNDDNNFIDGIAIYNVGTGVGSSVKDVVDSFIQITGARAPLNFTYGDRRPGDVEAVYAANDKIKKELNWTPKYNLADALNHAWVWQNNLETQ